LRVEVVPQESCPNRVVADNGKVSGTHTLLRSLSRGLFRNSWPGNLDVN
jgi:hypothetical protein